MKVVIAGSRSITDYAFVVRHLDALPYAITEVISGTAAGVDSLGERWAKERSIPVKRFPAAWAKYGKSAGFIRNREMAQYAAKHGGRVIVFWDGVSSGAMHMANLAREQGILQDVITVEAR